MIPFHLLENCNKNIVCIGDIFPHIRHIYLFEMPLRTVSRVVWDNILGEEIVGAGILNISRIFEILANIGDSSRIDIRKNYEHIPNRVSKSSDFRIRSQWHNPLCACGFVCFHQTIDFCDSTMNYAVLPSSK